MSVAFSSVAAFTICLLGSTICSLAEDCPQPTYRGIKTGAVMRFIGETGAFVPIEHGTIQTRAPFHLFKFSTAHSNGFSTEGISIDNFKGGKIGSIVIRKNKDFTDAESPAAFILTPELPRDYYYATNQTGGEAMHEIRLDDTWRLTGCTERSRRPD